MKDLSMKDLAQLLEPGKAVVAPCSNLDAGLARLKSEYDRAGLKVVTLHWASAAHVDALIEGAVEGLARLSRALWPDWCAFPAADDLSPRIRLQEVSPNWREAAQRYCEVGQLPLPQGYSAAAQAAQLVLTLAHRGLAIIMTLDDISAHSSSNCDANPSFNLGSNSGSNAGDRHVAIILRAVAEWLAANTSAPVTLLLPAEVVDQIGLRELLPLVDFFDTAAQVSHAEGEPAGDGKPRVDLFPVTGTPHPLSPGEQKLAKRLRADAELAPLFAFNQRITGRHGNQYIVDLVWPGGGLIVEVDSFQVHGNRFAFAQDRHRDYELMAANYRVLRITHDEAAMDTQSAVEKIRQLVRLVQSSAEKQGGLA
jgi:very-short-patch-repair endonuclease